MKTRILRFQLNPGTGQPEVTAPPGLLSQAEKLSLDRELRYNYHRLIRADRQVVVFRTPLRAFTPPRFRVRVLSGANPRCPTLLLVHRPPLSTNSTPVTPVAAGWEDGFRAELRELVASMWLAGDEVLDGPDELERAVEDLSGLSQEQPALLAPLLLAGYLALGQASPGRRYRQALQLLARCYSHNARGHATRETPAQLPPEEQIQCWLGQVLEGRRQSRPRLAE